MFDLHGCHQQTGARSTVWDMCFSQCVQLLKPGRTLCQASEKLGFLELLISWAGQCITTSNLLHLRSLVNSCWPVALLWWARLLAGIYFSIRAFLINVLNRSHGYFSAFFSIQAHRIYIGYISNMAPLCSTMGWLTPYLIILDLHLLVGGFTPSEKY